MELSERLSQAAAQQGILASALEDAVNRGTQYFTGEPTDHEIQQWAEGLRQSASHFFPPPSAPQPTAAESERQHVLDHLSPAEKLARYRREHPSAPRRKPERVELTPEQQRELASLPAMQRLNAYRALQQDKG
jgi:hypothetical protein